LIWQIFTSRLSSFSTCKIVTAGDLLVGKTGASVSEIEGRRARQARSLHETLCLNDSYPNRFEAVLDK
jgi:hypothetical protein